MNTIEQRVLIPVSPSVIWNILHDVANNPKWQVDCRQITHVSGRQENRGARWRFTPTSGRDYILEITAWYQEVGYEYRIVEGSLYKDAVGRIKLHETPDGTVVHWEFHYEMGGLVGGLRNSLLTRRRLENTIADSLWALWELANQSRHEQPRDYVYRSLMRDAPDAHERTLYRPDNPVESGQPRQLIPEPPIAEDDTRPGTTSGIAIPEFDSGEHFFTIRSSDIDQTVLSTDTEREIPVSNTEELPTSSSSPEFPGESVMPEGADDTNVSVFQLFGLKPPSQTKTASPEPHEDATESNYIESPDAVALEGEEQDILIVKGRSGLRSMLQKRQVRIRRPK